MSVAPTVIVVLAAVIERAGRVLVTRRLDHTHLGGLWEFPGGKCEPDETHEACLARELMEELGVRAAVGEELVVTEHTYAERRVRLHFRRCAIEGEVQPLLGQQIRWVEPGELSSFEFPAADREVVDYLSAPTSPASPPPSTSRRP